MDIKAITNNAMEKIESLSQREKIILAITVTVAVVVIVQAVLYSPSAKKLAIKKQTAQSLKQEVEAINQILSLQSSSSKIPEAKINLPEAEDLSGMLAAISREANMAKVDFISITPESIENKDKFTELKVKLELKVKFKELHDFLKNIEARHKMFLIQDIKFETNSAVYPSGVALLRAVTYLRKKQ